jgi:putative spermidine/putrescine transport system permease protein
MGANGMTIRSFDPVPPLGVTPRLLTLCGMALLVLPQIVAVITSIDPDPAAIFPPKGVSFGWYLNAFTRHNFREAFTISVVMAITVALTSTVIATMAAVSLVRRQFPGRDVVMALLQLPLMIPEVMLGLGFLILFAAVGMRFSLINIYLAHIVITLPYALRVIAASLQTVAPSLEEAAHMLGAGPIVSFVRVVLPIVRPGLLAAGIFSFVVSFDNFTLTAFLVTGRGTLPIEIYSYIRTESDPTVAAISTVLIVVSVAGILALEKVVGIDRLSAAGRVRA